MVALAAHRHAADIATSHHVIVLFVWYPCAPFLPFLHVPGGYQFRRYAQGRLLREFAGINLANKTMPESKDIKKSKSGANLKIPNRQVRARMSFLYQAANYLAQAHCGENNPAQSSAANSHSPDDQAMCLGVEKLGTKASLNKIKSSGKSGKDMANATLLRQHALPARWTGQIITLGRKNQAQLSRDVKRTICKRCRILLVPGETVSVYVENNSVGGRKPWADVLVNECLSCGTLKRFPIGPTKSEVHRSTRCHDNEHDGRAKGINAT